MKKFGCFLAVLVLVVAACSNNKPHLATLPDGTKVMAYALNIDKDCASVEDCVDDDGNPLVPKHQCGGQLCEGDKCEGFWSMASQCVNSDGSLKAAVCGSDADCANSNSCAATECNPYLFDGKCLTINIPGGVKDVCGIGACQTVVPNCKNGAPNTDQCVSGNPLPEVCNNADDNCDGVVDEGFGQTTCGKGVCEHTVSDCVNGVPQTCDPMQGAVVELCNGLDDDCDGSVDEDYPTNGQACDGIDSDQCANGTFTCTANGLGVECVNENPSGIVDICNNSDDDCDGAVDEDYPTKGQACDGVDSDFCKFGNFTCTANGLAVECVNEVVTDVVEVCDSKDNDCDGATDEENATGCVTHYYDNDADGFGVNGNTKCLCGPSGKYTAMVDSDCDDGNAAVNPSVKELCNGVDDNCVGGADEDFPLKDQSCDGVDSDLCAYGSYTCTADGSAVECVNENPSNVAEICDGEDNDCDGSVDEDFGLTTCGLGVCEHTIANCLAGKVQTCDPLQGAEPEVCDGTDNDCDGATDKELGENTCGLGVCEHTVPNCFAGKTVICDPLEGASSEVCDGEDNDCDGKQDEGMACSTCGLNYGPVQCWETKSGETDDENYLFSYGCKPTWNMSGSEAVFIFKSAVGGVQVAASVNDANNVPAGADLRLFTLKDQCSSSLCESAGTDTVVFNAGAGVTHYLAVDGYNGASAAFSMSISCKETACADGKDNDVDDLVDCADSDCKGTAACPAANEICAGGVDEDGDGFVDCADPDCAFSDICVWWTCQPNKGAVSCGDTKSSTTVGLTNVNSVYSCAPTTDESGPEAIYQFTAPFTGTATAQLVSSATDLDVLVLKGVCKANTCVKFGDKQATFTMTQGETYYLAVDGWSGNKGSYTLALTCAP